MSTGWHAKTGRRRLWRCEKDWAAALFTSMLPTFEKEATPSTDRQSLPAPTQKCPLQGQYHAMWPDVSQVKWEAFWEEFGVSAPAMLWWAARLAIWYVTFRPMLRRKMWRPFFRCDGVMRETYLCELALSQSFVSRQIVLVLKLLVSFAYFRDRSVRQILCAKSDVVEKEAGWK